MTNTPDESLDEFDSLPQWVLRFYDPKKIRPHVLVSRGTEPDTYLIQEIDFEAVNLYTVSLFDFVLPTKGEVREFAGSPDELYGMLIELEQKPLLAFRSRDLFQKNMRVPMTFGMSSDFTRHALTNADYQGFRQAEKSYKENPEDISLAYEFINQHPMFWTVKKDPRGNLYLATGQGWNRLSFELMKNKNEETGKVETVVTIETGPSNYHDYNLDAYAPSFDSAILEMAKLIATHYDSHGGFTDKTKKEPNDNLFREADEEEDEVED